MAKKAVPTTTAWQRSICAWVAAHSDRPVKLRALARELNIPDEDYTSFRAAARAALEEGALVLGPGRTLRLPAQTRQLIGVFRANRRGFGFVEVPEGQGQAQSLFIDAPYVRGARDGDTVAARLLRARPPAPASGKAMAGGRVTAGAKRPSGGKQRAGGDAGATPRAEIVRILERAPLRWVGILEQHRGGWAVQPQGRNSLPRVAIENPGAAGAQAGDLVVVEPDADTLEARVARGRIIERLGDPRDARAWIAGVIRRSGLREVFPPAAVAEARRAANASTPITLEQREDLRELLTVTIDPPDARDFDDAISIEALAGGRTRLGVHIADVAHFVPAGGAIDAEARARGTSVYFPGRVVPMLPESLSNDACSLRPGEERLTKSVFITYDEEAGVVATRFANSVIRSAARLSYEEVSNALAGGRGAVAPRLLPALRAAEALARRIQRRRLRAGMIALTIPEVEVRLDDEGRVVGAGAAEASFAHTIIEMFMVEANEAVSRALTEAGLAHLRRIHPPPEPEQAATAAQLAPVLGRRPPSLLTRAAINELLAAVRGRPEEAAVDMVLLRAMAQASYSPGAEGHFALASEHYCHFTSPIRRYPDLTVHRALESILSAGEQRRARGGRRRALRTETPEASALSSDEELAELGRRTSAAERRAQQAEREAKAALLLLFMQSKLGEVLDGVVTGVLPLGVFVQVQPYLAEGLIHVSDFGGDWSFDRDTNAFIGRHNNQIVHLGMSVRVQVAAVDLVRQELSLVPVGGVLSGRLGVTHGGRGEGSRGREPRKSPRRDGHGRRGGRFRR